MAEQKFIIEDGTLTKYEADDYVEVVYIPDSVKRIGCEAFCEAIVRKVVIPEGVTVIEADAFVDCNLSEIEIPDSVTTIETWAFSGCENLHEITIPESVTYIGLWAIGYREDHFRPWLDPIPFGRPVIIYGTPGSEAERYAKDNYYCFNEHITEFREIKTAAESHKGIVPYYDKADRSHMRRLLQKASRIIDLITENQVPLGSVASAEMVDSLAEEIGYKNTKQKDDDALQELKDDREVLINLYAAVKKAPAFPPLYAQLGNLLRKYGLFDEEVVLLENAISENGFSNADIIKIENRLRESERYRDADDASLSDTERISENLRRAFRKKPLNVSQIMEMLEQCTDDAVLYDIACCTDRNPEIKPIQEKAARLIHTRDYQYALSSHIQYGARTAMILNLYDSLEGDKLFIARTIFTDPNDENKAHMLLYCKDEALLMLGWRYVYGARRICADRLHAMGSRFPEAYEEMAPQERAEWEQKWLAYAAEIAHTDVLPEDEAVCDRISDTVSVDSEPLHFFLSIQHPRKAVRWWHARKLENQARIAYVGSWTPDDQIKEALSVKINNTRLITEMLFGILSAADLIFGFQKPKDLTLQNRFCVEIMKNHPDRTIREHVRTELLRGNVEIPGVDLSRPDPLFANGQRTR